MIGISTRSLKGLDIAALRHRNTGLMANKSKCKIFFDGACDETQRLILAVTGFSRGMLLVKYGGVRTSGYIAGRSQWMVVPYWAYIYKNQTVDWESTELCRSPW